MWFVTEVLPGIVLVVVFVYLSVSNVYLRKRLFKTHNELIRQRSGNAAIEMSELIGMVNESVRKLKEGD